MEGSTVLPQALVVTTAGSEFWFESRGSPTPSFLGDSEQPPGVAVIAGPSNAALASPFPRKNLLLANPAGGQRYGYGAGESFVLPGVFRVLVERHAPDGAVLGFEWLDRVAPGRPRLQAEATRRGRVRLSWDPPVERGSGLQTYTVVADGRMVRSFNAELLYLHTGTTIRLSRGRHRVGMFATDRAGNRGRVASVSVPVRQ